MAENVTILPVKRETLEPSFTRGWFESLHPEIDRFFVKIEATRRSGSYLNEHVPKGWKRILWLAMAAVAMGGGI
jgi:hypothetical protein